jgi:hypothetical protein
MTMNFHDLFVSRAEAKCLPAEVPGRQLVEIFEFRKPKTRYEVVRSWFSDWVVPRMLSNQVVDRFIGNATGLLRKERSAFEIR